MNKLENLLTEEFTESIGFYSTSKGLYRALCRNQFVDELAEAIQTGEVSQNEIRSFVSRISNSFTRGSRFPHESCLAAICVAMEDMPNSFSEEFLIDLARVNVTELPYSSKLAAICAGNLFRLPKTFDSVVSCDVQLENDPSQYSICFDYVESSELKQNANVLEMDEECAV